MNPESPPAGDQGSSDGIKFQGEKVIGMQIQICLHGAFRRQRFAEQFRQLPPETRVREVVESLQLPDHLLGIILINGVHAGLDDLLKDGDILSLLPMVDGG